MKGRFFCFVLVLQIVSWVSVATRPLIPPTHAMSHPGPKEAPTQKYTIGTKKGYVVRESETQKMKEAYEYDRRVSKIGSRPPSCEHKCYGCTPCEAIQVPTTSRRIRRSHLGVQYANYEPESWKCKCGPSFYSP